MDVATEPATLESITAELARLGPVPRAQPGAAEKTLAVAHRVMSLVLQRWRDGGVENVLITGKTPRPLPKEPPKHVFVVVDGKRSPSGKTIFVCEGCTHETTVPMTGACKGVSLDREGYVVAEVVTAFLVDGGRFEVDAEGQLVPAIGASS